MGNNSLQSDIQNSHATGTVTSSNSAGGLVGTNFGGSIYACHATGNATTTEVGSISGGLVGSNDGTIGALCYEECRGDRN